MLGINYSGNASDEVLSVIASGEVHYVDLMVDSFLHVPPGEIRRMFGELDLSFHMMSTNFLHRDRKSLEYVGKKIKKLAQDLRPICISDHLLDYPDQYIGHTLQGELPYTDESYRYVVERINVWQDILGCRIWIENQPSASPRGKGQSQYYKRLNKETGCGTLMDISNAVVAERNGADRLVDWEDIISQGQFFHIGGARLHGGFGELWLDTHDSSIQAFDAEMRYCKGLWESSSNIHIVVERDFNVESFDIIEDLKYMRRLLW